MIEHWNKLTWVEKLNSLTHGTGIILAIVGAVILLPYSFTHHSHTVFLCLTIFVVGMIWMYFTSTIYHMAIDPLRKKLYRKLDHIAIFGLIGGSYTPFIALYYNQQKGWLFLGILWMVILAAVAIKIFHIGKSRLLSTLIYLLLGWMVVFIYQPITEGMSREVFTWLVIGGVSYTIGVIFYLWKKWTYHHPVWHLFVMGGTFSHYFSLYLSR